MEDRIVKKISLEPLKSRVPGSLWYIGQEDAIGTLCATTVAKSGNYNKIISDIEIPEEFVNTIRDFTDIDILLPNPDEDGRYYSIQPHTPEYMEEHQDDQIVYYTKVVDVLYPASVLEDGGSGDVTVRQMHIFSKEGGSGEQIHKYLRYYTLRKWYQFFLEYYKMLDVEICKDGTRKKYDSFATLREEYPELTRDYTYVFMNRMDDLCEIRGGREFFEWMCEKCFKMYRMPDGTNYPTYMYYSEISAEIDWFEKYNKKFSGVTTIEECIASDDCCVCQEYLRKGGYDTYLWMISIPEPTHDIETKEAEITIPFLLPVRTENLGSLSMFAKEWDANEVYNVNADGVKTTGRLVLFQGMSYALSALGKTNGGFNYSEIYRERIFGNLDATNYNDVERKYEELPDSKKQWEDATDLEGYAYDQDIFISGVCDSSSSMLEDPIFPTDDRGQQLPGSLKKRLNPDGTFNGFINPGSYDTLDITYHAGNVACLDELCVLAGDNFKNSGLPVSDSGKTLYTGHIIVGMLFEVVAPDGTIVTSAATTPDNSFFDIESFSSYMTGNSLQCKIYYLKNARILRYDNGGYYSPDVVYNANNTVSIENLPIHNTLYVDTFGVSLAKWVYNLAGGMSYPIYYYKLTGDSSSNCIFYMHSTFMSPDNHYGGMIFIPTVRNEVYLGISNQEKRDVDIYIDRGLHTLYEKQLKLGEVASLDDLVQYGNGFYNILSDK